MRLLVKCPRKWCGSFPPVRRNSISRWRWRSSSSTRRPVIHRMEQGRYRRPVVPVPCPTAPPSFPPSPRSPRAWADRMEAAAPRSMEEPRPLPRGINQSSSLRAFLPPRCHKRRLSSHKCSNSSSNCLWGRLLRRK